MHGMRKKKMKGRGRERAKSRYRSDELREGISNGYQEDQRKTSEASSGGKSCSGSMDYKKGLKGSMPRAGRVDAG